VAERGAAYVADQAAAAVAERRHFTFAVSGGATPLAMFRRLAREEVPWAETTLYQVDERVGPAGHPDRNLTHLLESLPPEGRTRVRPMPVEEPDLEQAAAAYASSLPERLDLVHLGIGTDGHTASLIPGDSVLDVADRGVAVTEEYQGRRRMTLTYPVLNRARRVLWLVTGEDKVDALARLRAGDSSIPAGGVATASGLILADRAAAGNAYRPV
jgi:6-phosphogluconolactonase